MILRVLILLLSVVFSESSDWDDDEDSQYEWNYDDASKYGPSRWAEFYTICGKAKQSPINIDTATVEDGKKYRHNGNPLDSFIFKDYDLNSKMTMVNNRHGVQVFIHEEYPNSIAGAGLGATFILSHIRFHWGPDNTLGSEHRINNVAAPLEIQLVHYNYVKYKTFKRASTHDEGLAVLAVFVQVAPESDPRLNKGLGTLTQSIDKVLKYDTETPADPFALESLIPVNRSYFRYFGSLTTPSCDEVVTWTVFQNSIYITEAQMAKFRSIHQKANETLLLERNYRPMQSLNGRVVYQGPASAGGGAGPSSIGLSRQASELLQTSSSILLIFLITQ